jgi:hypothetical protein
MIYWVNVPDKNIKKLTSYFKNIIPIFQHSIIPYMGQKLKIYKTNLNSISYIKSEMLECGDYNAHGYRI